MSAVAEETKADVEAVKSVEDASYPTTASRELSHTTTDVTETVNGLSGEPTSSLPPTPRHSRKIMRDGLVYDFLCAASSASPTIAY